MRHRPQEGGGSGTARSRWPGRVLPPISGRIPPARLRYTDGLWPGRPEELFVVVDTKGEGRIVGVFDDRDAARDVVATDPSYYKLSECTLNQIGEEALRWARDDTQRAMLRRLNIRDVDE